MSGGGGPWGEIVDLNGGQALLLTTPGLGANSGPNWGEDVGRDYWQESSKRYLVVELDFRMCAVEGYFFFMDNCGSIPPGPINHDDSLFWGCGEGAQTNAQPGITPMTIEPGVWYRFGMEVDMYARAIIGVNYDGVWLEEDDSEASAARSTPLDFNRFVFRGSDTSDEPGCLVIDNLIIYESDNRITPENGGGGGQPPVPEPVLLFVCGLIMMQARKARTI